MKTAVLYCQELKEYDFGPGHPFRGDRYEIFPKFLKENLPEDDNYRILKAEWTTEEDLSLVCQKDYIDFTRDYFKTANLGLSFDGRFRQYHSEDNRPRGRPGKLEEAARLIIGQAKMAVDLIQKGEFKKVVSLGGGMHHASPDCGDGFCIYNDVAFAAKYLMGKYGLERILILDTDAHAGNGKSVHTGTCGYFYSDPKVLFIDLHQDPRTIYPRAGFISEIGEGEGRGYTINIPLPKFAGDNSYKLVFDQIIFPVVKEFKPQIIIRNGGSDPHFADKLTQLGLTLEGLKMIGQKVRELSKICDGKVVDLIGSGYNIQVLPYAWLALISGLANWKIKIEEPFPMANKRFQKDHSLEKTKIVIQEIKRILKDYWKCLR
ncbi:MAG: hypothetical protein COX34_01765 [Candidatus Nealsonbacteria bacterium CG23_combo_of_CG06-09_8_20_14_all_36_12]|uniref:Histone deacetylase domain-containing protein n=1 Tax=Candidatus Nealsonbacteria bacterium CG23_combo_of_CG06-09_8_20_14_all_36_12 TaxID=1974718 RepID=A0A2G9Z2G0_9BACT|nr:MAG: hypothetical protein COX34_01765 [Candidatus Nealsonbacteria bacterium CG23_combo_of_CG06-09_8_20_14_all_36_12]